MTDKSSKARDLFNSLSELQEQLHRVMKDETDSTEGEKATESEKYEQQQQQRRLYETMRTSSRPGSVANENAVSSSNENTHEEADASAEVMKKKATR